VIEMRRAQLRFDGVGPYLGHDALAWGSASLHRWRRHRGPRGRIARRAYPCFGYGLPARRLTHLGQHPAKPSTAGFTPGSASLPSRYSFGASMMTSVAPDSGGGVYIAAGHSSRILVCSSLNCVLV